MSLTPRHRGSVLVGLAVLVALVGWFARPSETPQGVSDVPSRTSVREMRSGAAHSASNAPTRPAEPHGSVAFTGLGADVGVSVEAGAPRVQLGLTRVGRGGDQHTLERGTQETTDDGARYRHAELDEWFRETSHGLEHGMTLDEPLPGEGPVELVVAFHGLDPVLMGTDVVLHGADGSPKLVYRDLVVTDASGKRLPTAMAVVSNDVVLRLDDAAAQYPVTVDPLLTSQTALLTASDGAANDEFGGSPFESSGGPAVAIDGNYAAIAASYDEDPAGAVYIFTLSAGTWSQTQKITPPVAVGNTARFGYSVALSGNTLVVGAPLGDGQAVVYERAGATFAQQAVLSDTAGEQFGCSVAVSGNIAAVGARYDDRGTAGGAVSVFRRVSTTWSLDERLKPTGGGAGDDFGTQVAIDEATETLAVGAIFHPAATPTGAVYVFTEPAATWTQQQKLVASDAANFDQFSRSLSLRGNRLLIGAPQNEVALFNQGAAYVFDRVGTTWTQTVRLLASDAAVDDQFGYGVALAPGFALIGARFDDAPSATDAGSTYAYRNVGSTWIDEQRSTASVPAAGDRFGDSVAVSGTTALVGAPFRDSSGANSGAAYIVAVTLEKANGESCTTASECDSNFCVDGVCCGTACAGGTTDCQACSTTAGGNTNGTCTALTAAAAPTITCRGAAGVCDAAEVCAAGQTACPPNLNVSDGTPCTNDGLTCTGAETCVAGSCGSRGLNCADATACTADSCAEPGGCTNTPISCDDNNECTADSCDPVMGCVHTAISCGDGNACNGAETCNPATGCVAGTPLVCNDNDACNGTETCAPATGCVAGTPLTCGDGNACNGTETCAPATGCVSGTAPVCNDNDACNGTETCDPVAGCLSGTALVCNDNDACNGTETCAPATGCVTGTPLTCVDANVCNGTETCAPATGCEPGTTLACDDSDACTADSCDALTGCDNAPISCDDSNACTADSCDAAAGCDHAPILDCCLIDDECDDNDSCTDDSCNGSNDCVFVDNGSCVSDAGVDGGSMSDAGTDLDGGTATDAGTDLDGGTATDAGTDPDGGTVTDGGSATDNGTPSDSGTVMDGDVPDASDGDAAQDGGDDADTDGGHVNGDGAVGDSGSPDAGGGVSGGGGCGCAIAETDRSEPLAWLGSVVLLGLVVRRRRARHLR